MTATISNDRPDEYTALQKYISTYRDPKAGTPEGQAADAADAGKGKAWWQFWRSGNSSKATGGDPGVVPEEWLEADIKQGISNSDVESRRKRFGWNEITTEKENLFIKFLGFFTGPVLYGKSSLISAMDAAHHVGGQWLVASFVLLLQALSRRRAMATSCTPPGPLAAAISSGRWR